MEAMTHSGPPAAMGWSKPNRVACIEPGSTPAEKGGVYSLNDDGRITIGLGAWYGTSGVWQLVTVPGGTELKIGDRVCKGPTWEWDDQGGPDPKGTVTSVPSGDSIWYSVTWDNGYSNGYRFGQGYADVIPHRETVAERPEEPNIVERPSHYARYAIEPVTFILRNGLSFWRGNIVKYVCRAGYKLYPGKDERESEITDLKKVIRYAEMRINQLNGEEIL